MAYRETGRDALFAYHLDRVISRFKTEISAENAEMLAALLGIGEGDRGNAA